MLCRSCRRAGLPRRRSAGIAVRRRRIERRSGARARRSHAGAAGARHDDRPRAGQHAAARRPRRLAPAGAHLRGARRRRRGRPSRTPARATAPGSTGSRLEGPAPLRDGSRIRMGNQELVVERRRDEAEAGRTVVVLPGESLVVPPQAAGRASRRQAASGPPEGAIRLRPEAPGGVRGRSALGAQGPRVRPLPADVGRGRRALRAARRPALAGRAGPRGRAARRRRRARRGWRGSSRSSPIAGSCAGVAGAEAADAGARRACSDGSLPRGRRPGTARESCSSGSTGAAAGGCSPAPALVAIAVLAVAGLVVFPYLVVGPLRDAVRRRAEDRRRGADLPARALRGRGRSRDRPRAHDGVLRPARAQGRAQAGARLPVRVRGHVRGVVRAQAAADRDQRGRARSPTCRSGRCSRSCCLALPAGAARDIFFQLAFAAYLGAFFNLNPFVDRDGYQILVDLLREPGLRRRARAQLRRRLSGHGRAG